jgi:hypothetical protein
MPDLPRQIRLAPGDYFMRGQNCRMRQAGLPGNVCGAVINVEDTQKFLNDCAPANARFATIGIRVFENTPLAGTAVQEGQIAPCQDRFEPTDCLSSAMAQDTEIKLDRIARRNASWQSPVDWKRFVTRFGRKVTVALKVRPQWKYIRHYGRWMRKPEKQIHRA